MSKFDSDHPHPPIVYFRCRKGSRLPVDCSPVCQVGEAGPKGEAGSIPGEFRKGEGRNRGKPDSGAHRQVLTKAKYGRILSSPKCRNK